MQGLMQAPAGCVEKKSPAILAADDQERHRNLPVNLRPGLRASCQQ